MNKNRTILLIIGFFGIILVGCSTENQINSSSPVPNNNAETHEIRNTPIFQITNQQKIILKKIITLYYK